jgi:methylenetetrahydrofolate reductase (NADPH)
VRHIVALRGDPTTGVPAYTAHPDGYANASDLAAAIRRNHPDMEVSVSAYPEKHPKFSIDADIDALKAKVDAGATRAITQFFFDNDLYYRYLDRVQAGITIPIVPGILPVQISSWRRISRPAPARPFPVGWKPSSRSRRRRRYAPFVAAPSPQAVQKLAKQGVENFHFYTMNRADLVFAISHLLGIRPTGAQKAA